MSERVHSGLHASTRTQITTLRKTYTRLTKQDQRCLQGRAKPTRQCTRMQASTGSSKQQQQQQQMGTTSAESAVSSNSWRAPLAAGPNGEPPVVALGKFDALHKGHLTLVSHAATSLGGQPWMMSFSGMAEVLRWPSRLPLVSPRDRSWVLSSWAGECCARAPRELRVPFAQVRSLSPEQFVELLAVDLRVAGVVVGSNYRFGYRAAGDTDALRMLGEAAGMRVAVLDLVGAHAAGVVGTVSSTKVREALAGGRMGRVADLLGRRYRLTAELEPSSASAAISTATMAANGSPGTLMLPTSCLRNQPPGPSRAYDVDVWVQATSSSSSSPSPAAAGLARLLGSAKAAAEAGVAGPLHAAATASYPPPSASLSGLSGEGARGDAQQQQRQLAHLHATAVVSDEGVRLEFDGNSGAGADVGVGANNSGGGVSRREVSDFLPLPSEAPSSRQQQQRQQQQQPFAAAAAVVSLEFLDKQRHPLRPQTLSLENPPA